MSYSRITNPKAIGLSKADKSGSYEGFGPLTISADSVNVTVKNGTSNITGNTDNTNITGGSDKDVVSLTGKSHTIHGKGGNDTIFGNGSLYGDEGDDDLYGGSYLKGGLGNDKIYASTDCHDKNTISYTNGDGNDTLYKHSENDILSVSGTVVTPTGSSDIFIVGNGKIVENYHRHFLHISNNNGTDLKTYLHDDSKMQRVVGNFNPDSIVTDEEYGTGYLYNAGVRSSINSSNNGSKADWIYNSFMGYYSTINGGAGDDTLEDHSAAAVVQYDSGNDKVILDDYIQTEGVIDFKFEDWVTVGNFSGRDNITHYYGAGLIVIDGTYNHSSSNKSKIVTSSGTMNVEAAENTFTVRENLSASDSNSLGSYKYTRYWEGKEWHSYVFRNDNRTTAQSETMNGGKTYDNGDASEKYQTISNISLTDERDYFYTNFGVNKVIDALDGDDFMRNWGAVNSTLIGGDGDDTIYNDHKRFTKNVTIDAGIGDDYVYNNSELVSIFGGSGKDTIYNGYSTDPTTTDNSNFGEVSNYSLGGASVTIDGGDDEDFIYSSGTKNTIFGGQGKDTVYNVNTVGAAFIDGGTEDDYIYNNSSKSTITGGSGKDTIINNSATGPASIYGGDDPDNESNYIYNKSSQSTIVAMGGNDTIYNMSTSIVGSTSIDAGDGNNFIYNNSPYSTITSGNGTDTIYNNSYLGRAVINSGDNKDTIYNHSYHATITGGNGDDSIVDDTANSQINYSNGDGNDIITFAKTEDVWNGDNLTYYYGGGLIAFTDGTTHTYGSYSNATNYVNIAPSKYTIEGVNNISVMSTSYYVNGSFTLKVGTSNLTVNTNCFTVREGTATDNYEYKRYWADTWKGSIKSVKVFNSYIYLDDVHNDNKYSDYDGYEHGTYDNPYSNDKYSSETSISLSANDDYFLANFGSEKVVYALDGDDYISNYGANKSAFFAGSGDDTLYNKHGKVSHTCLKGNGNTDYVTLDGSDGNDYIHNESKHVSIIGGFGNDTVLNATIAGYSPDYTTIDSSWGDDSVTNYGSHVSIVGGTGKDSIYNYGSYATINSDEYSEVTLPIFNYDDFVYNNAAHASIFTGYGNDVIHSDIHGNQVSIDSGEGNDSIKNDSSIGAAYIDGGNGDNWIYNNASESTIITGSGNDTIENKSTDISASIIAGDGENSIRNYSSQSTITSGSGNDTIYNLYDDTFTGINHTKIDAGNGDNYIYNKATKSSILSGTGNDTIINTHYDGPAYIYSADGDNTIDNNSSKSTIITGAGNDTIHNNSTIKGTKIDSGAGDDLIYNNASAPTIISGDGDDTIYNHYIEDGKASVNAGSGDDRVFFDLTDQVTIDFGEGDDIVSISSSNRNNKFVINDYGNRSHNIVYGAEKVRYSDLLKIGNTKFETMAVGRDQRDLLVTLDSGDFTYFVDVLDPTAPFDVMTAVVINNKTPNTYNDNIKDASDINLKNNKTNKLTVYNLDDMTTVVGSSVEKEKVDALESFYDLFADDALILDYDSDNATVTNEPGLGFSIDNSIVAGIVTVVGSGYSSLGSSVVAYNSIGLTRDNALTVKVKKGKKKVTVANLHYDKVNYTVPGAARTANIKEDISSIYRTKGITIRGNDAYNFIVGGKGNDSIFGGGKGDDTIEGGAGKDTLVGGHDSVTSEIFDRIVQIFPNNDIEYFKQNMNYANTFVVRAYEPVKPYTGKHVNENTITDFEEQDKLKVANGFIELGEIKKNGTLRLIVKNNPNPTTHEPINLNKATVNILKGEGKKITIINQDDTFSRQVYDATSITVGAADGQTINTLWNPNVVTIDSSERNSSVGLIGNAKNNLILSGIGNNTLATGSGKDTIVYYGGNDEIIDYTEKQDIIKLLKDQKIESVETVTSATSNAIDVIYNLNNSGSIRIDKAITITYKGGKAIYKKKKIAFMTDDGYTLQGSGTDLTLKLNGDNALNNTKINAPEISPAINIVDASSVGKKPYYYDLDITGKGSINGSKGNDTLTGLEGNDTLLGGEGNDVLRGSTGNDILKGDKGNDIFVYSSGNDTIADYATGDIITLDNNQKLISYEMKTKKHIILSIGTGSITSGTIQINNGKGKSIIIGDDTYTFNVKGATLKASTANNTLDISNNPFAKAVDASKSKAAVNIISDNGNNLLKGSKFSDTLKGGEGNDTLTGGKGNDVFVYNKGNDVITDYAVGDIITIASSVSNDMMSWTVSKNDVTFNLGNGNSIKVKNGKKKSITINNYTETYKKSGSSQISLYVRSQQNDEDGRPLESVSTQTASSPMMERIFDDTWFATDNNFVNDDLNTILSIAPNVFSNNSFMQNFTNIDYKVDAFLIDDQPQVFTYLEKNN